MLKKTTLLMTILAISALFADPACAAEPDTANQPSNAKLLKVQKTSVPDSNSATKKTEISSADAFFDKSAFIFREFVDDKGMVNYKMLKRKRQELSKLLDEFGAFDPNEYNSWSEKDKIAFWLNAYNLEMLNILASNYPIESTRILRVIWHPDSIRHIQGIWDQYKFIVLDEQFTLQEIDKRFFREKFNEPKLFFAITYASLSSPPLRNEPYYGSRLNEQLDDQVKKFLSNRLAFKIDIEGQKVSLSAIFEPLWYGQYFIGRYGTDKKFKDQPPATRAVLNFITNHISPADAKYLETANYTVEYINYNWRLNDTIF